MIGYVALRLLLTVAVAAALLGLSALLDLGMPVLVAAMLAIIVQLPLGWLVFGRLRERVTTASAESAGRRRRLRADLRDALADAPRADDPGVANLRADDSRADDSRAAPTTSAEPARDDR